MSIETENFILSNLNWMYQKSSELVMDGQAANLVKSGVKSLNVECKKCNKSWLASVNSDSSLESVAGGVYVTCRCGNEEGVQSAVLNRIV